MAHRQPTLPRPRSGLSPYLRRAVIARYRAADGARMGPGCDIDAFLAHVEQHLARCAPAEPEVWIDNLLVDELLLALACAHGDETALARFEDRYGAHLRALAHRYAPAGADPADMVQDLLASLVTGRGDRPARLLDYSGQGALRSWLKVTAVRQFIDRRRALARKDERERAVDQAQLEGLADRLADIELDLLKHEYRDAFRDAFATACAALLPEQRNLLRQNLLGGLSIDQLAALRGIHRSSAARRLRQAREQLVAGVRAAMATRLGAAEDVREVLDLVGSRVSLSLSRLLAEHAA